MIHPFVRLLVSRPQLLIEHAGGYADLAAAQMQHALGTLKARAVLMAAMAGLALLAVILGGMALLLVGAIALDRMPMPWLLWLAPLLPLLGALLCLWLLRRRPLRLSMDALREQAALDMAMLREAGARP